MPFFVSMDDDLRCKHSKIDDDDELNLTLLVGDDIYWNDYDFVYQVVDVSHKKIHYKELPHTNLTTRHVHKTAHVMIGKLNTINWQRSFPMFFNGNYHEDEELEEEMLYAPYDEKKKLIQTLHNMSQ
tara:strand:- start:725 stop:1105 length:381 start_codon:yes stop_codon:yes gene_type:complete